MVVSNWSFPWLFQSSFLFRSMRRGREGTSSSDLVTAGTESTVFAPVVSFGFVSQNKSNKHFMVFGCFIDKLAFETPTFYDHSLNLCSLSPVASLVTLFCLFFFRVLSGSVSAFWQLVFPLVFVLVFLLAFPLVSFLVLLQVSGLVFLLASLFGRCARLLTSSIETMISLLPRLPRCGV